MHCDARVDALVHHLERATHLEEFQDKIALLVGTRQPRLTSLWDDVLKTLKISSVPSSTAVAAETW